MRVFSIENEAGAFLNNNSKSLYNSCYMPSTIVNTYHELANLICTTTLYD